MKFKDIIIRHPDGSWELKQAVRVKTKDFGSFLRNGYKVTPHTMSLSYGIIPETLLEKELTKIPNLDIWELSI